MRCIFFFYKMCKISANADDKMICYILGTNILIVALKEKMNRLFSFFFFLIEFLKGIYA